MGAQQLALTLALARTLALALILTLALTLTLACEPVGAQQLAQVE